MRTRIATLLTLCLLWLLAGCATLSGPRPTPETPANDPAAVAVLSAGDIGALGCAVLATQLDAHDLLTARLSVSAAQTVLTDPQPSLTALASALSAADLPPQYVVLTSLIVQRVRMRLGQADVLPIDSTGYAMAEAFVDACSVALGAAPTA